MRFRRSLQEPAHLSFPLTSRVEAEETDPRILGEVVPGVAQNDNLLGSLDLLVLKSLAALGEMHGYGIVNYVQRASDDLLRVEEGSLYPALHRIQQQGWIASEWKASENNRRARYYRLTAAGRRQLQREQESWERVVRGVTSVLKYA